MTSKKSTNYFPPLSRILTLDEINGENINNIIYQIYDINKEDENKHTSQIKPIQLIINSFGGEVYSGLGLIDVIDNSKTPIYTICHGTAMSMALIIYAVGHKRIASKYSTFMYHESWYESKGSIQQHKQELKENQRTEQICDEIFLSRTKFNIKQLNSIKEKRSEYYFGVEEAKKYGLVDEII